MGSIRLALRALGFALLGALVSARTNEHYTVSSVCSASRDGNFMQNIPKTVDGVVLESRDERDEDCVISFQTESILEKFLLKFPRLHMDCNDHLYIYDGAHATGNFRAHITCKSTTENVGSNGFIITRTNFVTLRYRTDSWGTDNNGFTLVITAFKNSQVQHCPAGPGLGFQCDSNICISADLVCDGISHCGHGEDEGASNNCSGEGVFQLLGLEAEQVVGMVGLFLLLLLAGSAGAWIWSCRHRRDQHSHEQLVTSSYGNEFLARGNMSHRTLPKSGEANGTASRLTAVVDRNGSGNMHLPALGQGYKHWRRTTCRG